jgi:hypothetical protein
MQENPPENFSEDIGRAFETERHQQNAAILRDQLEKEGLPLPIKKPSRTGSEPILRILIGGILLGVIGWSLLSGFGIMLFELPGLDPAVMEAYRQVSALPEGVPVLIAIDYDPGFTGEMTAAALPVIDQLMLQRNTMAVVSSTPTGLAQGEALFSNVARYGGHQQGAASNYIMLGYIPASELGLQGFARNPRGALSGTLESKVAWLSPALRSVQAVDDFSMLVIITNRPDGAQRWIEQVGPFKVSPLVMILSSQAAPVIYPYFTATPRQVDGIVSGLEGGVAYENILGRTGYARTFWAPLNLGLLAALGLIVIGGLWAALQAASQQAKRHSQAGKARQN